jgi:[FeFe] hydrogenase H-cluster maturation GTPase HydF
MKKTPKSLRLHIGIFGRMNVGKSSFLNMIAGQDVAITSPVPGTTTDVVEKPMEMLPLGPVVFLDTAGLDDATELGRPRLERTMKALDRSDVGILLVEPGTWGDFEERAIYGLSKKDIPAIVVVNKTDAAVPSEDFLALLRSRTERTLLCSSTDHAGREAAVRRLKELLMEVCPDEFFNPPPLVGDLVPSGGIIMLIVPIDLQAPKGRLILPQVQTIRDALDSDAAAVVVKEREYRFFLEQLKKKPDLVVCDSQVVLKMTADTPDDVACTTFSILFSRFRGDLQEAVRGVSVIDSLRTGDKVLIAEACSHHALEDDIGRVKIPRWLRQYTGADVRVDVCSGRDYPENLRDYKLVIHCGACMITRREMLLRIDCARQAGVPLTNYGVCISYLQGILERVLSPFPAALDACRRAKKADS